MHYRQEGFIFKRKVEKQVQSPYSRSRSHDLTITTHSTLNTEKNRTPGEIKKIRLEETPF